MTQPTSPFVPLTRSQIALAATRYGGWLSTPTPTPTPKPTLSAVVVLGLGLILSGCASFPAGSLLNPGPLKPNPVSKARPTPPALMPEIRAELAARSAPARASAVTQEPPTAPLLASLEPSAAAAATAAAATAAITATTATATTPSGPRKDARFDLNVAGVSAAAVFSAIAHDSRLSVLVDPGIKGSFTVSLKDVTVREALEALQELYGFEYKVLGRKLVVQPPEPQTRVFKVNYPVFNRNGRSELRVMSGSIQQGGGTGGGTGGNSGSAAAGGGSNGGSGAQAGGSSQESSRISTSQRSDVWAEIEAAVKLLAPDKDNTQVVVSPQTGSIIVRAMPATLRAVERYLEAARVQVERQVMIEAKIIEVSLNESTTSGINWAAFKNSLSSRVSAGLLTPGASLATSGVISGSGVTSLPGTALAVADSLGGGLFGLAFQTSNFAAVISFLETQGSLQVLSSPRIATLNNQKAVLKVGSDDFFVTNISTTTSSTGNSSTTSPTISVQPFFSGISLDVTPQIDESGQIILHVHPQITTVRERAKVLNLGSLGTFTLPLASSSVNESDSIVRVSDGSIFAIGGLMKREQNEERSGLPGTGSTVLKNLFGQNTKGSGKLELVILLKPSVINSNGGSASGNNDSGDNARGDSLTRMLAWLEGNG